jgi:hypothetical protein
MEGKNSLGEISSKKKLTEAGRVVQMLECHEALSSKPPTTKKQKKC